MTSHPQGVVRSTDRSLGAHGAAVTPPHDMASRPVDVWNARYFDGRLSPTVLDLLRGLDTADASAQSFADRAFRLMRAARIDATDVSLLTAWQLGVIVPHVLPSAWGGIIPPITTTGRHKLIDEYILSNPWHRPSGRGVLLDLGCGFPPLTTVDSARRLTGWDVIGADPAFGHYIVYDEVGDYACFSDTTSPRYYQASATDPARWNKLHADPAATRARFTALLADLLPLLPNDDPNIAQVAELNGTRVVRHPLRQFEGDNLRFIHGGIGSVGVDGGADVIRCMNVLLYFDRAFRARALDWATTVLKPGGLFICGVNWARSTSSRYSVYQKVGDGLTRREFAFSIDCVRPIDMLSWYTLHPDEAEALLLADAIRTLRGDDAFRLRYDTRLDQILAATELCPRGDDGYLGAPGLGLTPAQREERFESIGPMLSAEHIATAAVEALERAGRKAWINCVGHIASQPDDIASIDALEARA
jgi:SAM-dependent methyltransferase